jgi:adenine phosphoribosyltransferase
MDIKPYIRDIVDFPKPGIVFKDITPLLLNTEVLNATVDQLLELLPKDVKIDKVVAMESRGFFFGTLLAQKLGAGFVPARKKGKLPFETCSATYELEYGTDQIEIHKDAIMPGENVLIHDDVLATGGTAKAVTEIVEELGGNIVQCQFLMALDFLNGKDKLKAYDVQSILHY